MRVKKSRFTRIVFLRTGQWLVHNLLSGSECILDDDEVAELNSANEREYDNLP